MRKLLEKEDVGIKRRQKRVDWKVREDDWRRLDVRIRGLVGSKCIKKKNSTKEKLRKSRMEESGKRKEGKGNEGRDIVIGK